MFEHFVNLNALALGLLQLLALEMPNTFWAHFPLWFRTLPKRGYPSEQIVRLALRHQQTPNLAQSRCPLLLQKLLAAKLTPSTAPDNEALVA